MSRRRHGSDSVNAPPEEGSVGESPSPGPVSDHPGRPSRGGRLWSLIKVALGLALVIGTSLSVAWGAHRYALVTPRFEIRQFAISGALRLSREAVMQQGAVAKGDNIFAVDLDQVEASLLKNPWIETVKVTRELPHQLNIELVEREARALVSLGDRLLLVSRTGEPFKPLAEDDPHDLPILTGLEINNLARDRARELERISVLLEVLAQYERLKLAHAFPPQELNISPGGDVTLTAGKSGVALHLGKGPWREKLLMAKEVMARVQRNGSVPRSLFLDNRAHPERVVVRMR